MASEVVADSSAGPLAKKRWTALDMVKELADLSVLLGGGLVSREKLAISKQKLLSGARDFMWTECEQITRPLKLQIPTSTGQDLPIIGNHCQISHVCAFAQQIPTSTGLQPQK